MTLAARDLVIEGRLAGVSASFEPGRITAICGPNGAGKSTLLQALAGLLEPLSGSIELDGAPLPHGRERARRIGYLPQVGEVAWDLSVAALASLGRLPHGDRGEAQVAAALEAVLEQTGYLAGLRARLREAANHRPGGVLVRHDLALAQNHADHVVVLGEGLVEANGPPEAALAERTIARTWGVTARWLGEPGARALVAG